MIIPVAFRLKEPLRNLDTFDQSGTPLSVLRASAAAPRSAAVLQRFARNVAPELPAATLTRLNELLTRIVTLPAIEAAPVAVVVRRWVALSWPEETAAEAALFVDVVEAFSRSFVLMLELPDDVVDVRSMLKFSYELPVDILEGAELPYNLELDGPQLWMSDSCHLEIATPPGVQIRELVVRDRGSGQQWRDPAPDVPNLAAGHRAQRRVPAHNPTLERVDIGLVRSGQSVDHRGSGPVDVGRIRRVPAPTRAEGRRRIDRHGPAEPWHIRVVGVAAATRAGGSGRVPRTRTRTPAGGAGFCGHCGAPSSRRCWP